MEEAAADNKEEDEEDPNIMSPLLAGSPAPGSPCQSTSTFSSPQPFRDPTLALAHLESHTPLTKDHQVERERQQFRAMVEVLEQKLIVWL